MLGLRGGLRETLKEWRDISENQHWSRYNASESQHVTNSVVNFGLITWVKLRDPDVRSPAK
jgi:hypothetical protein